MKQIIETVIKERDDYRFVKIFDEEGYEGVSNITSYNAECKHCDFVQVSNSGNIISHLKNVHGIEYVD